MIDEKKLIARLNEMDCIKEINGYTNNPYSYDDIMKCIHDLSEDEQDFQLTVQEIDYILNYPEEINIFKRANIVKKLRKQKEMLKDEKIIY